MQLTKQHLLQLKKNDWDGLINLLHNCEFPLVLPPEIHKSFNRWPLWVLANQVEQGVQQLGTYQIIGDNWANDDKDREGYPKRRKLADVLSGLLWGMTVDGNKEIPPMDVYEINGEYYAGEGNHRIYGYRLMERKTIPVRVYKVEYQELLDKALLFPGDGWLSYLGVKEDNGDTSLKEINKHEYARFRELGVPEVR